MHVFDDFFYFFFFKQKTAYEMRISDWSSDVCSSDLHGRLDVITLLERALQLRPRATGEHLRTFLPADVEIAEDLFHLLARCLGADHGFGLERAAHADRRNALERALHEALLDAPLAQRATRDGTHQTGRASSRARVCQYVKVAVVAV